MTDYHSSLTVRNVALALAVLTLESAKRDQILLQTVLGRHNSRNMALQKLLDKLPSSGNQAGEKEMLKQEAASSQEQLANLQRCFNYASQKCISNRLLIISHCKAGEEVSFRLTDALALEETAVERAMLLKIDAEREGILAQAAAMNSSMTSDTVNQQKCLYQKTSGSVDF